MYLEDIGIGIKLQDTFDLCETTYQDVVNHLGLKGPPLPDFGSLVHVC